MPVPASFLRGNLRGWLTNSRAWVRRCLILATLLTSAAGAHAQLRPNADWRTFETPHFRVVFEAKLEPLARHAAERAELAYSALRAGLIAPPSGRIDLILGDNTDLTNGAATPFPSNRVLVWVRPPVEDLSLQFYNDWIDLVVVHELTHIFHMDRAGAVGRVLRTVFGRVPFGWPFFPVIGTPSWNLEGLATLQESRYTGTGRVHGSYHEMIVRTAVLENRFDPLDRVSGQTPIWPGGTRPYIYGSLFMDYIARRYGHRIHGELIRATAGSVLPPGWRMDGIARKVTGRSFSDLYEEWQNELRVRYSNLADSLRREGLTEGERLTEAGRWALFPRVSPDGRLLAFAQEDGRNVTRTRVLRVPDSLNAARFEHALDSASAHRRNGLGPVSWLRDGSFITAQYQFAGRYSIYSDLYRVAGGDEQRLTRALRIETPHAAADGRRVVAVVNDAGSNHLVVFDLVTRQTRALTQPRADAHWILPRWSPDGARIAVQRWSLGGAHDIVVLDTLGSMALQITNDAALDAAPAWSPDGRYVVFSSDRTGIPNLYAAELAASDVVGLYQVTNVLSGAFHPEVCRDGWLYYSAYHADGFHVERIRFDAALWRNAPATSHLAASDRPIAVADAATRQAVNAQTNATQGLAVRKYSPFPSVLPRFWVPVFYGDSALGTFIGAATLGIDDVNRHTYFIQLAAEPDDGRVAGNLRYAYAGFGNPVTGLELAREWDYTGRVALRDSAGDIVTTAGSYEREDRVALTATLTYPRWRSGAALLVGAEGVVLSRGILGPARFRDPQDRYAGALVGIAFSNTRSPPYAISPEDGLRATVFARRRFDLEPDTAPDATYTDLNGSGALYKSINLFGFAHHVLALRSSAVHRRGLAAGPTDVGGAVDFLPVRGFEDGDRIGFTAWSASLEYRVPLALIGRGYKLRPLFIDRMSLTGFFDAANASCTDDEAAVFRSCPGVDGNPTAALLSVGAELNTRLAVLAFVPFWLRGGFAIPVQGERSAAKLYIAFGQAF